MKTPIPSPQFLVNVLNKRGHHVALISTTDSGFVSALEGICERGDPQFPYRVEVTRSPANGKKKGRA